MLYLRRFSDLALPLGVIGCLLVLLMPLPAAVMDLLLAGNITVAVLILLATMYVRSPLDFNVFPSLLLTTTLARLVLNVATTRMILTAAHLDGHAAAGKVVQRFGEVVAGNQLVVGFVLFAIMVVIQYVVITKGATRISEVAARFTLDGLPGRQMAIDSDLNAGLIDAAQARSRREELARQADFYAAMDGASKFVQGDAIAGLIITGVNIVGGLFVGLWQGGMQLAAAADLYTRLTIGDGLVSQLPALLISLAAAMLVTRSGQDSNLRSAYLKQLVAHPQALLVAAGFLGVLIITRLPAIPLLLLGAGCVTLSIFQSRTRPGEHPPASPELKAHVTAKKTEIPLEECLVVDPIELQLGIGLIRLADPQRDGDLLTRIAKVRQHFATELGMVMPKVRIRDNLNLGNRDYRIHLADNPVALGSIPRDRWLALPAGGVGGPLSGESADPRIWGADARWIADEHIDSARRWGYEVLSPSAVLTVHLRETTHRFIHELLTRDATKHLIEQLRQHSPTVVDELIKDRMTMGQVQQILRMLLEERVPIRQLALILETLSDVAVRTTSRLVQYEQVRRQLARTLCTRYRGRDGRLYVLTLDNGLEARLIAAVRTTDEDSEFRLPAAATDPICRDLSAQLDRLRSTGHPPVLLTHPQIRRALKRLTQHDMPELTVLSHHELTGDTPIVTVGQISASESRSSHSPPPAPHFESFAATMSATLKPVTG